MVGERAEGCLPPASTLLLEAGHTGAPELRLTSISPPAPAALESYLGMSALPLALSSFPLGLFSANSLSCDAIPVNLSLFLSPLALASHLHHLPLCPASSSSHFPFHLPSEEDEGKVVAKLPEGKCRLAAAPPPRSSDGFVPAS